jgi:hypothetical protein
VARVATGDPTTSQLAYGATTTVSAPPSVSSLTPVDVTPDWGTGCTALLCYGRSRVGSDAGGGVVTDAGLPRIGSLTSPMRASVTDTGSRALTLDNVDGLTGTRAWSGPVVQLLGPAPGATSDCPGFPTSVDRVSASTYLTTGMHTGSQTLRDTAACAGNHAATIGLLPTVLAPDGILQVTLSRSYASCGVTGGIASGSRSLDVTVKAWNGVSYAVVDPRTKTPGDYLVGAQRLDSYIESWTLDEGVVTASGSKVTVDVPGFTVTTTPTRWESGSSTAEDIDSAVLLTVGAASCSSESDS